MINWREIPLVRLLFALVAGILLAIFLPKSPSALWLWTGLIGGSVCLIIINFIKIDFKLRWVYGVSLTLFLILLGWQRTLLYNELTNPQHFQYHIAKDNVVIGKIVRMQPTSTGKARLQLWVESIQTDDSVHAVSGHLLAYLDSAALAKLQYGDRIVLYGSIVPLEPPKNPKAFDFARYMHFQNVHYQTFVKPGNWQLVAKGRGWDPFLLADRMQKRFISILRKHVPGEDEFAVASALILGYRDEISEEVNTAYRNTGATHILAVSGMHVGFIYIGVGFLLGFVKSNRKSWKIIKVLIELGSIWFFALITGGAASILRAAVMFSVIIFGKLLQRETNIYNSLAASAFGLLFYNPYYIMDVGFQLSYLALLGIVYFEPKIYKLLYVKYKVLDYLWQLTAVALAAQIVTLPISLFYFHQFPWYFWLSGLAVVPASVVVLGAGFLLFIVDAVPLLGWLVGKIIFGLVWLINHSIFLIQQIPGATTNGIWINFGAVILLYLLILFTIIAINTRRFRWILVSLSIITGLSLANVCTEWRALHQEQLVVYHIAKHTAIDYIAGKQIITIYDEQLTEKKLQFANQNYHWFCRAQPTKTVPLSDTQGAGIFELGTIKVAIIDDVWRGAPQQVDYVIIRSNPYAPLQELLQPFDCQKVIFDASNYWKKVKEWQEEAKTLSVTAFDVNQQGAFILNIKKPEH